MRDVRHRARTNVVVVVATVTAIAIATSGCGLSFSADRRVELRAPHELDAAAAPVRVSWRSDIPPTAGLSYALFLDRTPLRRGQSLRVLADDACKHSSGCPNAEWLAERGVFITKQLFVDVPNLPVRAGRQNRRMHSATLVLIDADGRRSGEAAWSVSFREKAVAAGA